MKTAASPAFALLWLHIQTDYDKLIIAEVMIAELDKVWWKQFKQSLEQIFNQDEILIRCVLFEKL